MGIDVITIFPDYLKVPDLSLIGKAVDRGLLDLYVHDPRDHAHGRHRTVDDTPLGGGVGMVVKPGVWSEALDGVSAVDTPGAPCQVLIVPTPAGEALTQCTAEDLAEAERPVFACSHYEGIDACVPEHYASRGIKVREPSIGDYVLNGGEVATIAAIETIVRPPPRTLGNPESLVEGSHGVAGLLEYPVHTRPTRWRNLEADPALLSGDHGRIARVRRDQAPTRTVKRRLDMIRALDPVGLDHEDHTFLARLGWVVPAGVDHPVPVRLRNATADDAHALVELAAYILPDTYGNVIDPELFERHVATNLVPELFATWADGDRVDLIFTELFEPPLVRDGNLEGRTSTSTTPALVGYTVVLYEEADLDGEWPHGIDPRPVCVRPAGGEAIGELSKMYADAAMRGSGLAPAFMDVVTRQASAHGADLFWLDTHVTNKRAQKAYKRAGFRQVGTRTYNVGGQDAYDVVTTRRTGEGL